MATAAHIPSNNLMKPKSMSRPKHWSDEVEEVYRFQLAGYRDRHDYAAQNGEIGVRYPNLRHHLSQYCYL